MWISQATFLGSFVIDSAGIRVDSDEFPAAASIQANEVIPATFTNELSKLCRPEKSSSDSEATGAKTAYGAF